MMSEIKYSAALTILYTLGLVQIIKITCRKTAQLLVCRVFPLQCDISTESKDKAGQSVPSASFCVTVLCCRSQCVDTIPELCALGGTVNVETFAFNPNYFNSALCIGLVCFMVEHVTSCQ